MAGELVRCGQCGQRNRVPAAARQTGAAPLAALRAWAGHALATPAP